MNRFNAIGSALLLVPALTLLSTQARAEFKCNAPAVYSDRAACEKAKEGAPALRRYIERIRMIDSLQFSDYVSEAQAREWALAESSRATVRNASVQTAEFVPENPGA